MVDSLITPTVLTAGTGALSSVKKNGTSSADTPKEEAGQTNNDTASVLSAIDETSGIGIGNIDSILPTSASDDINTVLATQDTDPVSNLLQNATVLDPAENLLNEVNAKPAETIQSSNNTSPLESLRSGTAIQSSPSSSLRGSSPTDTLREFIGAQDTEPGSFIDIEV